MRDIFDDVRKNRHFKKMFKMVGADIKTFDFASTEWYTDYQWTEKQCEDFKKWMIKDLMKQDNLKRKLAECRASMFDLMWGWKIKKEGE